MICPNCQKEFSNKKSLSNHTRWHKGLMSKESYLGINKGETNPNWNGGTTITKRGYRKVLQPFHHRADKKGYVYEHILIAEQIIGRMLNPKEVVHHIDRNKLNNVSENLHIFASHSEHLKEHHHGYLSNS